MTNNIFKRPALTATISAMALTLFVTSAQAEMTQFYNLEGFGTWLDGNPESTTVTETGAVTLGSMFRERYEDPAATFGAAAAWGDDVILARIDDGTVISVDRAGKTKELFKAKEGLVTAIEVAHDFLWVAIGSPARIVRVDRSGKKKEFHSPDASFIWDMAPAENGGLFVATGEPGTVVQVDRNGGGKVIFAPEQDHIRSLAFDKKLGLFVGGGQRGIVYRGLYAKDRDFHALFDSGHPEITAIVLRKGVAYAAGVTGAGALAAEDEAGSKGKVEVRAQLSRIEMDGTAEVLAGSSDEAIFAAAVNDRGQIVVSTGATGRDDPRGRLYTVEPEKREIAMLYQSPSRRITHLVNLPRGAIAAIAADGGRVVHFAGGLAPKGEFFTSSFDTSINARFGTLQLFGDFPKGTSATAAVRSGQTKKPDESWSPWSKEISSDSPQQPQIGPGRFLQIRLTLTSKGTQAPRVKRVRMAYLRQNLRPFVRSIVALPKGFALYPVYKEASKTKSIELGAKSSKKDKSSTTSQSAKQVEAPGALTIKWAAEDPNDDQLLYKLEVRSMGQDKWRLLEDEMSFPFYSLHSSQLPDGHYQFRVTASDELSNADGHGRSDSRESDSILVDNTPPTLDPFKTEINGTRVVLRTVVADAVGPLLEAHYSVDGERLRIVAPDDGVLDGPGESITLRLGELDPGFHTVTLRVKDEGGNETVGEAKFSVSGRK